jgi:hypothetical protein
MVATIKKIERKVGCMELTVNLKRKNGKETRRRKKICIISIVSIYTAYVIQEYYK